jgi:outer membrane protein
VQTHLVTLCFWFSAATTCVAMGQMAANTPVSQTTGVSLTREQAEETALRNNPRISISHLIALAQHQVVRESRSAELPTLTGSLTAEAANDGSRVASGALSDSRLFQHAGGGVGLSQLITDFGHTTNLIASSKLLERAQNANEIASKEDIVVATDQAFYNALQAQALLKVAQQTVSTRQTTQGQVNQLTQNKIRSTLDLSFANVTVSQAKLLELDASNDASATMAALDEVLGLDHETQYTLVDSSTAAPPPPPDVDVLVQLALKQRPDLQALDFNRQAEQKLSRAQEDQKLPTITALGTVGGTPVRPGQYFRSSWDGGVAANVNVPIFNGFLFSAQAKESSLRANAAGEQTRQLRNRIVRDVHTAWLEANNAFQRIGVTAALLDQSNQSLGLAQTRYQLGLSSIVELSQAQLQQTQADISHTNAEYQYRISLAALNYQVGAQP